MNTLDSQINMRLWRPDTWRMGFANLLLTMSLYMLFPVIPQLYLGNVYHAPWVIGGSVAVFGLGVFLLGPFFAYLIDLHSRKRVCQISVLLVLLSTATFYIFESITLFLCLRLVQGAAFGMAQMALGSTLVLDLTETKRRTESGSAYAWFGRFAVSLGPLTGLLIYQLCKDDRIVILTSVALSICALFLISLLKVPFRAPLKPKIISLDRFWLPRSTRLFMNFMPVAICIGIFFAANQEFEFYAFIMVGFLLALVSHKIVFTVADLRAEAVCGFILLGVAMLLHITHNISFVVYGASVLTGLGVGLVAPRFLLYFIKVSEHCERGTAQSSYMLCWESGICLGFFLGFALLPYMDNAVPYIVGLALCMIALLQYQLLTHRFLVKNRLR